jgi:hypothetical protein
MTSLTSSLIPEDNGETWILSNQSRLWGICRCNNVAVSLKSVQYSEHKMVVTLSVTNDEWNVGVKNNRMKLSIVV